MRGPLSPALGISSGTILVVDDAPENLVAIGAALDCLAPEVTTARSGEEALRHLLERDFALILLDVQMPGMDGLETARLIRNRERSRHVPIIFVTGCDRDEMQVLEAYRLGAVDFLHKPIDPEILRAKAAVFVELQQRTEEVARQSILIQEHERAMHERALAEQHRRLEEEALRRRLEETERLTRELARKNHDLSETQRKLEATNDRLAEDDRRKNEFIAVLAHELRNPLAPLVTGVHLLESVQGDVAALPRVCEAMRRQIHHLVRLVDDLLDISRITSGKIELCRETLPIDDVLTQAVDMSSPALAGRNHTLKRDLQTDEALVNGDVVRLSQVISNLLNNAARYTEEGGVVTLTSVVEGDSIRVDVRDSGMGMSEELLARAFDIFAQGKAGGGGLGVGLTLVKELTEMHGGRVRAHSDGPGQGSTVTVWLPMAFGPRRSQPAATPIPRLAASPSLSIVLIDDNDDIRETIGTLLESWGHRVRRARCGAEGLELLSGKLADVALIDIGLPDMEGYDVARRARAALGQRCPRLIAISGFGQKADRKRAKSAGFDRHLAKPVAATLLHEVIARAGTQDANDADHKARKAGEDERSPERLAAHGQDQRTR